MMTVREIAKITGISVRTLHYYDEIGLLAPTAKSEAGYRLYDDKALETLQQILFFREFDIPLKEIKNIMDHPDFDKRRTLQMQRKILVAKKERMERLIASMDDILEGENRMDFTVFDEVEICALYEDIEANMNEEQKAVFVDYYGSMEMFREHFMKNAGSKKAQMNFAKLVEWYGSKEAVLEAVKNPKSSEVFTSYQKRMESILERLAQKKGMDVNSFEIRELVGEYDFVSKQLYQMENVQILMLELAKEYRENTLIQSELDSIYGDGSAAYIGEAIEAFYSRE